MTSADADPDDSRPALAWKFPKANKRQEERFPRDGAKFFRQRILNFTRDICEEGKSKMDLARLEPAYAAQMRIQFREKFRGRARKLDAYEKPLRAHRGYTPTAALSGDRSSAGLLKQNAKMAPIKQRKAPARNGV